MWTCIHHLHDSFHVLKTWLWRCKCSQGIQPCCALRLVSMLLWRKIYSCGQWIQVQSKRKATLTCRFAARTSLTAHPFFGACELAALRASSNKRTLFPEKRILRSAGRRGKGGSIKHLWRVRQPENPSSRPKMLSRASSVLFSGCLVNSHQAAWKPKMAQRRLVAK